MSQAHSVLMTASPFETGGAADGARILLLHGLGVDSRMWYLQVGSLQKLGPVLAPDLPGFGNQAPLLDGTATPEVYTEWVARWLGDGGRVHVVGYSMGGTLALLLALRHPERVSSVTCCCSSPCWGRGARSTVAQLFTGLGKPAMEIFEKSVLWSFRRYGGNEDDGFQAEDMVGRAHRPTMLELYRGLAHLDLRSELGRVQVPTLAVAGSRDWLAPPSHVRLVAEGVPHGRLRVIDGADHFLCISHPRRFSAILTDFLRPQIQVARTGHELLNDGTTRRSRHAVS